MKKRFVVHPSSRTRGQVKEVEDTNLIIRYSGDYDIISLDDVIRKKIQEHMKQLSVIFSSQLTLIEEQIENCDVVMEMRELDVSKARVLSGIDELDRGDLLRKYSISSYVALSTYRDTPLEEKIIDAMNTSQQALTPGEAIRERMVDIFMEVVSNLRLPSVTIIKEKKECQDKDNFCHTCDASLLGCNVLLSGLIMCSNCGSVNKPKSPSTSIKEYDVLANLMKAHKRYIGMTAAKCDLQLMMVDLDEHFVLEGDKKGEYYRALPLDSTGRKAGTSQEKLCAALKFLGYGEFYKNYMYIGHHYYGWKLPDLRHIQDDMIRNFRIKQDIWDNHMTEEERGCQSSLSTEYRLCREYQHAGYECNLADFKISKKKKTIERYDKAYAIMCKRAGFEDIFSIQ